MFDISKVKGVIFDYGGTIDSNGTHWAEVLWSAYQQFNIPVTKEVFREAYVYGERYLATHPVIKPEHNFGDLLKEKVRLQISYLVSNNFLEQSDKTEEYILAISNQCYNFARDIISEEKTIIECLRKKYPMVLVSNFYGNIHAVLEDFGLLGYFDDIIESAVVGVRKPDPAIFGLGVEKIGLPAENIVVIGDSNSKDIVPATKVGCQTIWLKGPGWGDDDPNATADLVITDFMELKSAFELNK
ncbi:HAD family hydrolase [Dysgonomonas sp. 216]|uniref:HAD family hydrolase n=1 Tax=Dysgonomonas sp. 216 TaxID=2302934 RepID=UPI0013CFA0FA|nr:HAD family hydrolase [Dysgonomonas sp. 216]NDW18927.1 HAD family hydrolase [Dysgonomonas sp. 216]